MTIKKFLYVSAFVLRCAGSATLGYVLAQRIGLPFPLWTAISAVVVSQERLAETKKSVIQRTVGTALGVCIAIVVNAVAMRLGIGMTAQMAVSVGVCAAFACGHPMLRAAMFTCPIVLLTALPSEPMFMVGFYRGSEVIIGGLLANAMHIAAEKLFVLMGYNEERQKERRCALLQGRSGEA